MHVDRSFRMFHRTKSLSTNNGRRGGSAGESGGRRYDGKKGCLIAVRDAIVDSCNEIKSNREGDGFCPGCMNFRRTTINYSKLNILRRF